MCALSVSRVSQLLEPVVRARLSPMAYEESHVIVWQRCASSARDSFDACGALHRLAINRISCGQRALRNLDKRSCTDWATFLLCAQLIYCARPCSLHSEALPESGNGSNISEFAHALIDPKDPAQRTGGQRSRYTSIIITSISRTLRLSLVPSGSVKCARLFLYVQ